jgi:flagellar protein FlaG
MAIDSISRVANTGYSATTTKQPVSEAAAANDAAQAAVETKTSADAGKVAAASKQQDSDKSGAENQQASEQKQPTMKDVSEINKVINQNTIAEFGYNEPTNRITIKIKDKETDEVIKEIPSEKALEMLAKAWELAGIMVDEKR